MTQSRLPAHPGKIVLIDEATNQVIKEMNAADLPETMTYGANEKGTFPIVRMEVSYKGDQRIIRKYGPDGEYLGATIQIATKPQA